MNSEQLITKVPRPSTPPPAQGKAMGIPPLGLKPRFIHEEERRDEIKVAVFRMFDANYAINVDWIREYNEIVNRAPVLREREGSDHVAETREAMERGAISGCNIDGA